MAGRGITIDILANVRDALKGTGDVEKALADIESTLEDMAAEGDQSVEKLSRGFRDLARDTDQSTEKMERSLKDVGRTADKTGKEVSTDLKKGFDDAKSEAGQSGREAAASFSGGFDDITDFAQETLANAFSGFGPGGAALGVVAAAGLGIATALFAQSQEDAEKAAQAVEDAFQRMVDAKSSFVTESFLADAVLELTPEQREAARKGAEKAGVTWAVALRAAAGDTLAQSQVTEGLDKKIDDTKEKIDKLFDEGGRPVQLKAFQEQLRALQDMRDRVDDINGVYAKASGAAGAVSAAVRDIGTSAEQAETNARRVGQAIGNIPTGVTLSIKPVLDQKALDAIRFKAARAIKMPIIPTTGGYWKP